ncbi:type II toxin-antitoxin system HicB family antitoxin [Patescibacteria group bacterium]|nr:type II toxin-antitoxin system HicB family antitoxin [Patescibacteria group bacterium]MBU1200524.1 type II toxin-antitoxin system HicB family antitoxin [Patescibacteria group bacterium]MBU1256455.1 type II toxin-antitoxin system HicB family antitoxin [Patescibacteria group bacterium]MBU1457400.1 type II toxin-antitoxin system HicB family antitoxin [Patescibacteria group bacterium]
MKRINLKDIVWKEGKYYVSWNLNTGVSSFGDTKKEALESLKEALGLHLEEISPSEVTKIERPNLVSSMFSYA